MSQIPANVLLHRDLFHTAVPAHPFNPAVLPTGNPHSTVKASSYNYGFGGGTLDTGTRRADDLLGKLDVADRLHLFITPPLVCGVIVPYPTFYSSVFVWFSSPTAKEYIWNLDLEWDIDTISTTVVPQ